MPRSYAPVIPSAAFLALVLAGCGSEGPTDRSPPPAGAIGELPAALIFEATASGTMPDGLEVECMIMTYLALDPVVDRVGTAERRRASGGGEAYRSVFRTDDIQIQFWAHTMFERLELLYQHDGTVELRSRENESAESRFWRTFSLFAGSSVAGAPVDGIFATGNWTCQPMDTPPSSGDYHDPYGYAEGTWVIRLPG